MRPNTLPALFAILACDFALLAVQAVAQQPPANGASRRAYFGRLSSPAGATTAAGAARARSGSGYGAVRTGAADRGGVSRGAAARPEADPLSPYGNEPSASTPSRPYERRPVLGQPEREIPAPARRRDYFPGARPGQGPNQNVVRHCVPGRHAFLGNPSYRSPGAGSSR